MGIHQRRRPIPLVLAAGGLATSIGFLASSAIRNASPIFHQLGVVAYIWQAVLLAGALGTIYGVMRSRPKAEAAGLVGLAGGWQMYVVAAFESRGLASWTAGIGLATFSIAEALRGRDVTKGRPWS